MKKKLNEKRQQLSRRDFIKASGTLGVAAILSNTGRMFAAGSDKVRVGLIGCGGRGVYDTTNCLNSAENIELVAMGDLFKDHLDGALQALKNKPDEKDKPGEKDKLAEKVKVTEDSCFVGWDAYKKVVARDDVDMVILTEAPHFRAEHLKAAVEAGKHVFMEKPVAVDPVGVRSVIESSALADKKKLTIVAGTQMRRIAHLVAIMERIHNGDLGRILGGQCVRFGDGMLGW